MGKPENCQTATAMTEPRAVSRLAIQVPSRCAKPMLRSMTFNMPKFCSYMRTQSAAVTAIGSITGR